MIRVCATARAYVNASAGRAPVFGGELIGNHLYFGDGFERRLKAFARRAVVVIIQALDSDVVGKRCAAG